MIDKLKELENLENKYKEIGRINSEIESIIANIKNEAGISREKELLKENERLAEDLKAFHEKMKVREEEIGRLKNSNAVLIEELKEAKKVRRNSEIDKFQNILADKMNVELESGVTRRLSNYAEEMKRKVKISTIVAIINSESTCSVLIVTIEPNKYWSKLMELELLPLLITIKAIASPVDIKMAVPISMKSL